MMKRFSLLSIILLTLIVAACSPGDEGSDDLLYDPSGPDRDCGDFSTWKQANDFFIAAGGPSSDRHRLDGDNDTVPCEALR